MSTEVKRRRGSTSQHSTFVGAVGEVTVDTTKNVTVVHDGSTTAGFPLLREDLSNLSIGSGLSKSGGTLSLDNDLSDIAALSPTDGSVIIGNGTDFITESGATLRASLGVAIGSDVQAWDAQLDTLSGLSSGQASAIVGVSAGLYNQLGDLSVNELSILDGATLSTTELNYVDGVTSAIQTQLNNKQPLDSELTTLSGMTSAQATGLVGTSGTATFNAMAIGTTTVIDSSRNLTNIGTGQFAGIVQFNDTTATSGVGTGAVQVAGGASLGGLRVDDPSGNVTITTGADGSVNVTTASFNYNGSEVATVSDITDRYVEDTPGTTFDSGNETLELSVANSGIVSIDFSGVYAKQSGTYANLRAQATTAEDVGVDKDFIDGLGVDASTLDGLNSTAFMQSFFIGADDGSGNEEVNGSDVVLLQGGSDISVTRLGTNFTIDYTGSAGTDRYATGLSFSPAGTGTLSFSYNTGPDIGSGLDLDTRYVPASGGTFSGDLTINPSGSSGTFVFNNSLGGSGGVTLSNPSGYMFFTANGYDFEVGGSEVLRFNGTTDADFSIPLKVSGNTVWHEGNLPNPVETGDNVSFGTGSFDGTLEAINNNYIQWSHTSGGRFRSNYLGTTGRLEFEFFRGDTGVWETIFTFPERQNPDSSEFVFSKNVAINQTSPSYTLDVNGTIRSTGINYASDHQDDSDARLKTIIQDYVPALKIAKHANLKYYDKRGLKQYGLIAQDLMNYNHNIVGTHKDEEFGNIYTLSGYSVASIALAGVKELNNNKAEKSEVERLKQRIADLESEVQQLRRAS